MRRLEIIAFAAAALAYATPAVAQGKGKGRGTQRTSATVDRTAGDIFGSTRAAGHDRVPPGHLPPAGMCRVWIDGVVTNDGRQCVQRTDRNGNVRYECRDGRYDPSGVYSDQGRVYGRDDDEDDEGASIRRDNDRDDFELRGAGNAGNGKGNVKNKSKGKHGRG